jgi:hypothetical protein
MSLRAREFCFNRGGLVAAQVRSTNRPSAQTRAAWPLAHLVLWATPAAGTSRELEARKPTARAAPIDFAWSEAYFALTWVLF